MTVSGGNWKLVFLCCGLISSTSVLLQLRIKIPEEKRPPVSLKNNFARRAGQGELSAPAHPAGLCHFSVGLHDRRARSNDHLSCKTDLHCRYIASNSCRHDNSYQRICWGRNGRFFPHLEKSLRSFWNPSTELVDLIRLWSISPRPAPRLTPHRLVLFSPPHLRHCPGGKPLIWNLPGTIFSQDQNSTAFTTVNVLMIGLRGAIGPLLGSILCNLLGPMPVFILGALIAFSGVWLISEVEKNRSGPNLNFFSVFHKKRKNNCSHLLWGMEGYSE